MNRKILRLVEDRLLVGEKKYGHENVVNDGRDFIKEALEESLDLAVYVSAKLIEIIEIEEKEKQMGRAIDMENDIDTLKKEMKELQGVVAELSGALMQTTQVHHVDLVEEVERVETIIGPDEVFTPPVGKRKKAKTTKSKRVESTL